MKDKDAFTKEALERIRSGDRSIPEKKGRKTGRIILILDAVVIVLILLFFFGRDPRTTYKSTTVSYSGVQYRLSVSASEADKDIIFSLSLKNNGTKAYKFPFSSNRGKLTVRKGESVLHKSYFTGKVVPLILKPGEIYTETISVAENELKSQGGKDKPKNKGFLSLFNGKGDKIRLNALAEIFLNNILTLSLNFTL